jgi:hypothetical protein
LITHDSLNVRLTVGHRNGSHSRLALPKSIIAPSKASTRNKRAVQREVDSLEAEIAAVRVMTSG